MQESKRQRQVARLIQEELSDIFQRQGLNISHGGMISISGVKMTPDLLEARVYVSFYQITDPDQMLALIKDRKWEIKKQLAARIKHQLRRIPELQFFRDDTLEQVFRLEEIFKKIHEQDKPAEE
ncbi:MAG: 30S ribosome-binding factor RbfA [Thermoflavifilum sp.]|uniref:30S ribosome-binding factor RbfA n=1 Tax=Thermoflavifilum sp. TaxID=1968839 RepID=UPI0018A61DCF|nr:30S ribosome-binding factor RbfA [Thermoflavifilum sp.]QOR74995.1 MAG: 30S ribosome-binding factor RbfA [Thermoflavifilum sp.]